MGLTAPFISCKVIPMTTTQTTATATTYTTGDVETAFFCWHYGRMDYDRLTEVIAGAGMSQEDASAMSKDVAAWIKENG